MECKWTWCLISPGVFRMPPYKLTEAGEDASVSTEVEVWKKGGFGNQGL